MGIRLAVPGDLALIQDVERRAGRRFRAIGMTVIADDEPPCLEMLRDRQTASLLWVVTTGPHLAGYLAGDVVEGTAHVLQVSVDPGFARQGAGARLLNAFEAWAAEQGMTELTLTTFRDVPWNAPYYTRLGWTTLPEAELSPGLERIRTQEKKAGLDQWPRVVMRKPIVPN